MVRLPEAIEIAGGGVSQDLVSGAGRVVLSTDPCRR